MISRNVAKLADAPALVEREQSICSPSQTVQFLELTRTDRLYPLYLTALGTGLRRGELAGLRWCDIDLEEAKITVSSARVVVNYAVVDSGPKTAKGKRTIAIGAAVVETLRAHRRSQLEERLA